MRLRSVLTRSRSHPTKATRRSARNLSRKSQALAALPGTNLEIGPTPGGDNAGRSSAVSYKSAGLNEPSVAKTASGNGRQIWSAVFAHLDRFGEDGAGFAPESKAALGVFQRDQRAMHA